MTATARPRAAVILAAGQGTRMKTNRPKVLHKIAGRTLIDHAIDAAQALGCERIVVVCGDHSPQVAQQVAARLGADAVAIQSEPKGTGDAVRAAEAALDGFDGDVVVTFGDVPLLAADNVAPLFNLREAGADLAVLGFEARDPVGYGRLILDSLNVLLQIVEDRDADADQKAVTACNSGVLACDATLLFSLLAEVTNQNAKLEFYLTDIVGIAHGRGLSTRVAFAPEACLMGINDQAQLAQAEAAWQAGKRQTLMLAGVAMLAPETVMFAFDTQIAAGAAIEPFVVFGPGVFIESDVTIRSFSHVEGAHVRAGAIIGPHARLRPGADIGEDAHIGNFVEVKKVKVGKGAKANHLAYLGDGTVGAGANIGAGTIFCNYDGFDKYDTHVGEGAFIGSDTALVAPVSVGAGAYVGSGSVITKNVTADALALARGHQVEKPGWATAFRARKRAEKGLS